MIEDLPSKNMKELRAIAKELGLSGVKAESAQALRARITLTMQPGLLNELNKNGTEQGRQPTASVKPPIVWLTAQEVVEELRPFQNKIQLAFYDENGHPSTANAKTWHVKNGPAEDSGSMTISKKWLLIKVGEIANARFPAKHGNGAGDLSGALSV